MHLDPIKSRILSVALSLCLFAVNASHAQAIDSHPEYAVKAAYIFNVLRFIDWPESPVSPAANQEINVCLLGNNQIEQYLRPIESKKIGDTAIKLMRIDSAAQTTNCHLVFIANASKTLSTQTINNTRNKPIITIGNNLEFTQKGGLLAFYIVDNKVRLSLNKNTLDHSTLKASALLLEVCDIVEEES